MPRATELMPTLLATHLHLDHGRDGPALARYAMTLARIERVYLWLEDQEDSLFRDASAGKEHPIYDRLARWEHQAERAERELGLSPTSRARLGLDHLAARAKADDSMDLTKLTEEEMDVLEALHEASADPDRPIQGPGAGRAPGPTKLDSGDLP